MATEKLSNKELRERAWKIYLTDDTAKLVDNGPDISTSINGLSSVESQTETGLADGTLTQVVNETATAAAAASKSKKAASNYLTVQQAKSKASGEAKLKKILDNENAEVQHIEKKLRLLNEMQSSYKRPHGESEVVETVQDVLVSSGSDKMALPKSAKKAHPSVKCLPNQLSSGSNNKKGKKWALICEIVEILLNLELLSLISRSKPLMKTPKLILQTDVDGLHQLSETQRSSKYSLHLSSSESLSGSRADEDNKSLTARHHNLPAKSRLNKSKAGTRDQDVSFDVCETVSEQITTV